MREGWQCGIPLFGDGALNARLVDGDLTERGGEGGRMGESVPYLIIFEMFERNFIQPCQFFQ